MNKILDVDGAIKISRKLRKKNKRIVVAGGFFDVLHLGHIKFLEKAKEHGDYLFVLLEEDSKATKIKGNNRPINSQKCRATILSALKNVDYIIMLKNMTNNESYDKIMIEMQPDVIATTFGDPYVIHKERQARLIRGKVINVIKRINDHSTTKYIKLANIN
jgi:FAD synthetase